MNIHEALAQVLAQQTIKSSIRRWEQGIDSTLVDLVARLTSCVQELQEDVETLKVKVQTGNE